MKNGSFTQLPNSLITANIPDALFRLLAYCYSNRETFRYNVPHCVAALRASKRNVQRLFKVLVEEGIYTLTTPEKVKFGSIPNYLFDARAVPAFLEKTQATTDMAQPAAKAATQVASQPATEVATQATPKAATKSSTNNTNKQDQETKLRNKTDKQDQEPSPVRKSHSPAKAGLKSSHSLEEKRDSVSSFEKMIEQFKLKAERSEVGSLVPAQPAEGIVPVGPVDTGSVVPPKADNSSMPKAFPTLGGQRSAPEASVPTAKTSGRTEDAPRFNERIESTIRTYRESWARSPINPPEKVLRMELDLRKRIHVLISAVGELEVGDLAALRYSVERAA